MLETLGQRARRLKQDTFALYLAARHPGTPWYAKAFAAGVAAYAFSPIDLIPDFVPVVGYLDDLILIPLGIAVAVRLVPAPVLADCRTRAAATLDSGKPVSRAAAVAIVITWLALASLCALWVLRLGWQR